MAQSLPRVASISLSLIGLLTDMSAANDRQTGPAALAFARAFIPEHEQTVRPLEHKAALAWWNANVTGRDEDFQADASDMRRCTLLQSRVFCGKGARSARRIFESE